MKAKELAEIILQFPNAEVTIVQGEDDNFGIEKDKIYFNKDSATGEMFIDIDIEREIKRLRVYHIANGEMKHQVEVGNVENAIFLINKWAEEDLNDESIEFNVFGLEEYSDEEIDGEHWTEYYNEDGEDITEIMDRLEEEKEEVDN